MSREILIEENKVLKLKNVLSRTLSFEDGELLDKKLHMFQNYLKNNKLESFGPLIINTYIERDIEPKLIIKAMIQLKIENPKLLPPYVFEKELKVGPCLFSRFEGNEQHSGIAQSKMQVYAYENYLILGTESYMVYKDKKEETTTIDVFIPLIGRESNENI